MAQEISFRDIAEGRTGDRFAAMDALMPPIPPEYADWVYRDIQWMPRERFGALIDIAGPRNVKALAFTTKGDQARGQFWISPEGIQNLAATAPSN